MMECLNGKTKYAGRGKNHSGLENFDTVPDVRFWFN